MASKTTQQILSHIKRYTFLGTLTLIPVALTFFIINGLYRNIDKQFDKLLPTISGRQVTWFEIFALFFVIYLIGIISSYVLGTRVKKVTKRIANLFPHVQDLNQELKVAQRIHQTIIPENISTEHVDIAVDYIPCNVLGGDFVQYYFQEDKKLFLIIGDVTGHGLPAALLTNRLHMEFDNQIAKRKQPGNLMKAANDFVFKAFKGTNMYFTALCAFVDLENMKLTYSSYGHLDQYIYKKQKKEFVELRSHATMLGITDEAPKGSTETSIHLDPGDRIILFTDGIPETEAANKTRYSIDLFKAEIEAHKNDSVTDFNQSFLAKLWQFTGHEYEDDVCLMSVDIKGGQAYD